MRIKSAAPVLTITWLILFALHPLISMAQNPLTKAIQLFDQEKFTEAEALFEKLISEKPDDFMINYFYGACRTRNGHFSPAELRYLQLASREVNPLDIDYYLAVQQHAAGNFEKALEHYTRFATVATPEEKKKLNLPEKTEQCKNQLNPFAYSETEIVFTDKATENIQPELVEPEIISTEIEIPESQQKTVQEFPRKEAVSEAIVLNETIPDTTKTEIIKEKPVAELSTASELPGKELDETLNIPIETKLSEPISEPDSAHIEQISENSDSVFVQEPVIETTPTASKIKSFGEPLSEKFTVNNQVVYEFENCFQTDEGRATYFQAIEKQAELKKVILRADILREKYLKSTTKSERDSIGQLILELETLTYDYKNESENLLMKTKNLENEYWTGQPANQLEVFLKENDDYSLSLMKTEKTENKSIENIIIPTILIEESETLPDVREHTNDLVYKIQIGAYSRGLPPTVKQLHEKLSLIRKIENYTDENGVTVYTTGELFRFEDAQTMLKQVQQEGVKDAIIASYLKGKRITLEKAKETEGI